ETTAPIAFAAGDLSLGIQGALPALTGIGGGDVVVSRGGDSYTGAFLGAKAGLNAQPIPGVPPPLFTPPHTKQSLQLLDATGGTYTLTVHVNGTAKTTGPLKFNAPANTGAGNVQTALETAIENAGIAAATNVQVTLSGGIYTLEFTGNLAGQHVDALTADAGRLTNNTSFATLTNVRVAPNGSNHEFAQIANDVQQKLDDAAVAAGITPGFLVSGFFASGATFTATAVPFGAPNMVAQG